jgi:hypothetical protein
VGGKNEDQYIREFYRSERGKNEDQYVRQFYRSERDRNEDQYVSSSMEVRGVRMRISI